MKLSERITAFATQVATIVKTIAVSVDKKQDKENWFTLVSGYSTVEDLAPIPTGEVIKYTYQSGAIRYRFIAYNDSEDSFYLNYANGTLSNLTATKKIAI